MAVRTRKRRFKLADKLVNVTSVPEGFIPSGQIAKQHGIHISTLSAEIRNVVSKGESPEKLPFRWLAGGSNDTSRCLIHKSFATEFASRREELRGMLKTGELVPFKGIARKIETELRLKRGTIKEETINYWLFYTALSRGRRVLGKDVYVTSEIAARLREIFRFIHRDTVTRSRAFEMLGKKSAGGHQAKGNPRLIDKWLEDGLLKTEPSEAYDELGRTDNTPRIRRSIVQGIARFYKIYCAPSQTANIIGINRAQVEPRISKNKEDWFDPGKIVGVEHPLGETAHEQTSVFVPFKLAELIGDEIHTTRFTSRLPKHIKEAYTRAVEKAKIRFIEMLERRDKTIPVYELNSLLKNYAEILQAYEEGRSWKPSTAKVKTPLVKTPSKIPSSRAPPPKTQVPIRRTKTVTRITTTPKVEEKIKPTEAPPRRTVYDKIKADSTYSVGDILEFTDIDFDTGKRLLKKAGWGDDQIQTKYGRYKGTALLKMLELLGKKH